MSDENRTGPENAPRLPADGPPAGGGRDTTEELTDPGRSLTLTDGVVAIAMTLLALDLKPALSRSASAPELWKDLRDNASSYYAFALAFVIIANFWVTHQRATRDVEAHDSRFTFANMVFLFGITLLPVSTSLLGNFGNPLATSLFAGNLLLISLAIGRLDVVANSGGLRRAPVSASRRRHDISRTGWTVVVPVVVIAVAWLAGPWANALFVLYALQGPFDRVVTRWERRRYPAPR